MGMVHSSWSGVGGVAVSEFSPPTLRQIDICIEECIYMFPCQSLHIISIYETKFRAGWILKTRPGTVRADLPVIPSPYVCASS